MASKLTEVSVASVPRTGCFREKDALAHMNKEIF